MGGQTTTTNAKGAAVESIHRERFFGERSYPLPSFARPPSPPRSLGRRFRELPRPATLPRREVHRAGPRVLRGHPLRRRAGPRVRPPRGPPPARRPGQRAILPGPVGPGAAVRARPVVRRRVAVRRGDDLLLLGQLPHVRRRGGGAGRGGPGGGEGAAEEAGGAGSQRPHPVKQLRPQLGRRQRPLRAVVHGGGHGVPDGRDLLWGSPQLLQ